MSSKYNIRLIILHIVLNYNINLSIVIINFKGSISIEIYKKTSILIKEMTYD